MGRGRRRPRRRHGRHRVPPHDGGTVDWPGLTGPSPYTPEGNLALRRAVARNLVNAKGARGVTARALWFPVPILAAIAVPRVWRRIKRWWAGY